MTGGEGIAVQLFFLLGTVIVGYYVLVNVGYFTIHVLGLLELRDGVRRSEWQPPFRPFSSPFYPGVAMVVPAYNEQASIVESIRSMLSLNYPDQEIVVVNDGSTDETLERLQRAFNLEPVDADIPYDLPTEPVREVYRSTRYEELLVVDKENGGKSDALNAGVWLTDQNLFCAVDSDTVIERNALLQIVRPFLEDPERTVATGGTIRVANNCQIEDGEVQEVALPKTNLAGLQVMEYLRAFYCGRLGFNRINGLVLISGAFGVFRTDYVREIGGYRHDTITEDLDIVVRLHEYLSDRDIPYKVDFVPEPIAWTEVPESVRVLGRQRRRWYRGMVQTAVASRHMFFNPAYGRVGVVILPFFIAAEAFGPLIEGLGYILLPLAWALDLLSFYYFVTFFLLTTGFGVFLSWFGVFSEVWTFNRYESPWEIVRLLWYGVLENFGYRQWKTIVAWQGLIEYLRGENSWGVMERSGFGTDGDDAPETSDSPSVTAVSAADSDRDVLEEPADCGFIWTTELVDTPAVGGLQSIDRGGLDADGFIWNNPLVGNTANASAVRPTLPVEDPTAGGFVWTTDPTDGVGDGGFVWVTDPLDRDDGGFVWTTDFAEGAGDGGFVWVTELAPTAVVDRSHDR